MKVILVNKILMINNKKDYLRITENGNYLINYNNENIDLTLEIDTNIKVTIINLTKEERLSINTNYILHDNSELTIYKFYHIKNVTEEISFDLNGINSSINYFFRTLSLGNENYHLKINHNNINTKSIINNKAIAFKEGNIIFELDSNLGKKITGCTLSQDTTIITLDDSKAKVSPNMYIENDDVIARHGSAIGTFSDDEVFYLMSRGIDYNNSVKLLIKGILLSNLEIDLSLKEKILNIINMYWR